MDKLLSKHILKQSTKSNWKLWAILSAVLCFFIIVMTITAPKMAERASSSPSAMFPNGFSLNALYAMVFFGMMGLTLMLIYMITAANKLVVGEVDKGTMSFTLNTPTTRKQLIFSKALFYVVSIIGMALLVGILGTIAGSAIKIDSSMFSIGNFWIMILGFFLYGFAVSGICFLASCWFNKSSKSIMVGAGIPIAFFLFNQLSGIDKNLDFLKYFSINTLFDASAIAGGGSFIIQYVALFVIGIVLYVIGINKFLRKDLPL